MKAQFSRSQPRRGGFALVMVMILSALALAVLASVLAWSASSAKLTHRSIDYTRSVAASEAATEKVLSQIGQDFLTGGERLVSNNLTSYYSIIPTSSDSPYWNTWLFNDGLGDNGQTFVQRTPGNSYVVLGSAYAGLQGYVSTYTIVSHAIDTASAQQVMGGVSEQIQLTGIPIFQFMMFSYSNMEVSCGEPFDVTGRVHANGTLYVEPDNALTFESSVTALTAILFQRDPVDPRGLVPSGTVVYVNPNEVVAPSEPLTLPVGIEYSPDGIREIVEPPPAGGDTDPAVANLRYYNECEMLITVSDSGVSILSGGLNLSTNDIDAFVTTSNSFYDDREGKTVDSVDIDITNLDTWLVTNLTLNFTSIRSNLTSIYVQDNRNLPANQLGAVRVKNGTQLPPNGLTVATSRPLYVLGDYNELSSTNLGTSNTSATRPASLVADAITILSDSWSDASSTSDVSLRNATATTVNAAFLTGVVETTSASYSGGMENFPRFLETWGSAVFTYNGSMIKMFPSLYATGSWGQANVYVPPTRNWAYDINFDDPTKLPPLTPSVLKVIRYQWATVAPGQNVATAVP